MVSFFPIGGIEVNAEQNELQNVDEIESPREILRMVYEAMSEKGYNPIGQIVGYLLSEDPTYITNYKNARGMIRRIDRDELMAALLKEYLGL